MYSMSIAPCSAVVSLQAPLSGSNNMTLCCLWCASGPITMTASTEKKAFVPGTVSIHPSVHMYIEIIMIVMLGTFAEITTLKHCVCSSSR